MLTDTQPRWRSRLKRSPRMRKVGCSNPSCNRPALKQVVTVPLVNVRQQIWVSRSRIWRFQTDVLCHSWLGTPTNTHYIGVGQNLKPGTDDVSIWLGRKIPNKGCQQLKQFFLDKYFHWKIIWHRFNFFISSTNNVKLLMKQIIHLKYFWIRYIFLSYWKQKYTNLQCISLK